MAIRPAHARDHGLIVELARARHQRQHRCDPELWAGTEGAPMVEPARAPAHEAPPISLVATVPNAFARSGDAVGHIAAQLVRRPDHGSPLWHIASLEARPGPAASEATDRPTPPADNDCIQRVMLAGAAAAAHAHGGGHLVIGVSVADDGRERTLRLAGFAIDSWFRHLRIGKPDRVRAAIPEGTERGLPLPHLHEFADDTALGASVVSPGGHALVSRSLTAGSFLVPPGQFAVVDPAIANDAASMMTLISAIEGACRDRGDEFLFIAVGPAEEQLDHVLAALGYRRSINWWTLQPRD